MFDDKCAAAGSATSEGLTPSDQVLPKAGHRRWIQVFSGALFYPLEPRDQEINILDIGHALSLINRYTGHTKEPYSVAQHCLLVSEAVEAECRRASLALCSEEMVREFSLQALLHDAAEAYMNDLSRPLKRSRGLEPYRYIEQHCQRVIFEHYGLANVEYPLVKQFDRVLLCTEARDLMSPLHPDWAYREPCLPEKIVPWDWKLAKRRFFIRFHRLTGGKYAHELKCPECWRAH